MEEESVVALAELVLVVLEHHLSVAIRMGQRDHV